jgi:hypothetical protein
MRPPKKINNVITSEPMPKIVSVWVMERPKVSFKAGTKVLQE